MKIALLTNYNIGEKSAAAMTVAEKLGKYKTAAQDACLFIILISGSITGVVGDVILWCGLGFFALASVLTVVSGLSYVLKNKQVLKDTEK